MKAGGFGGLASAPTTVRKTSSLTDGQNRREVSVKAPSGLMMSRTVVKPVSMEIIVASIFGPISLSVTLLLEFTRVAEGLAEHADDGGAFAYRQK